MAKALGHSTGQQDAYAKQIDGWGGVEATRAQPDCTIPEPVLDLAAEIPIRTVYETHPLADANVALQRLFKMRGKLKPR